MYTMLIYCTSNWKIPDLISYYSRLLLFIFLAKYLSNLNKGTIFIKWIPVDLVLQSNIGVHVLTNWTMRDADVILNFQTHIKDVYLDLFLWNCYKTSLMINQNWFR